MEIKPGQQFKVNSSTGEIVTVLYVENNDCLLLRKSGNLVRANGYFVKGNYIFWNGGDYGDNSMFRLIMEEV